MALKQDLSLQPAPEQNRNAATIMAEMAAACTSCGKCVSPCAFLRKQGAPAAIAANGSGAENLMLAYDCSLCGLCDAHCPLGLTPSAMFLAMRRQAVSEDLLDLKPYRPLLSYEQLGGSALFRRDFIPQGCTTVFFPGCSLPGTRPAALRLLFRQLQRQDAAIGLVLDCCGKISSDLGLEERFETLFERLLLRLKNQGITRVLTSCPGCTKTLESNSLGISVMSIYPLLAEAEPSAVSAGRGVVAVHDPCTARFNLPQQQAVRRLIENRGYQVRELPFHGAKTRCCGQGGMVEARVPGTVSKEASVIGEKTNVPLITSCAACCDALSQVAEVAHIADLLTGRDELHVKPPSSLRRWLNRLKLRWSRLD